MSPRRRGQCGEHTWAHVTSREFEPHMGALRREVKTAKRLLNYTRADVAADTGLDPGDNSPIPIYMKGDAFEAFNHVRSICYMLWLRKRIEKSPTLKLGDYPTVRLFCDILTGYLYPDEKRWHDELGMNEEFILGTKGRSVEELGEAMRGFRMLFGLNLHQVAEGTGYSVSSIASFERGEAKIHGRGHGIAGVAANRYILRYGIAFVERCIDDDEKLLDYEENWLYCLYDYLCKILCFGLS